MSVKSVKPGWMLDYKAKYGIWPIAGGAGEEEPPAPSGDTITVPDPEPPTPTTSDKAKQDGATTIPEGEYFTKEDIARIRKEEKDKLYGRLQELDSEVKTLREAREEAERLRQEEEERIRAEAEAQAREELDAKGLVEKVEQEWQEKFQQLQEERERDRVLLEKEREFAALKEYKQSRLTEAGDAIMPHLIDLVDGNSPEEIDAAIEDMTRRSSSILEEARSAMQSQRQQMQGTRPTVPGIGPVEENDTAHKTFTPEQIKQMSPKDYAKYRESLKQAVSQQVSQYGLYGGQQ